MLVPIVLTVGLVTKIAASIKGFVILPMLLALTLSACAASESINATAAQATLAEAWQVDQHTIWEIDWPAAPVGGPLTVETWRAGSRYRYEILEAIAPNLVGQTLIFDGQTSWRYNRFGSEPPAAVSSPLLSPVTDAFMIINQLMTTIPEAATQEAVHLPTGLAQKMTLTFNQGNSLTLWRDEATGLPVRLIFVLAGQRATVQARTFEPLLDPPEGLFHP